MLNRPPNSFTAITDVDVRAPSLGAREIYRTLLRGWRFVAVSLICCLSLAITIIAVSRPSYVAGAKVLVETRGPSALSDSPSNFAIDTGFVDSQVEVLGSASIATSVIRGLHLQTNPAFTERPADDDVSLRQALTSFGRIISIRRIGQSYVIEVSAQASSPELAATIANKVVDVYLSGQWKNNRSPETSRFTGDVQRAVAALTYAQVITRAEIPSGKSSPKSSLIVALALVSGLMAGGTLAISMDKGQPGLQSCRDISRTTGFKALQTCPRISSSEVARLDTGSFIGERPPAPYREALMALKTSIDTNLMDHGARTIGVLSLSARGGATAMVESLAKLYADAGSRVLVIDANFHSPLLSTRTAPAATMGLLEMLMVPCELHSLVSVRDRIAVLPLVGTHPSIHAIHLLRSPRMIALLAQAKASFDVVLVDMPAYSDLIDGGSIKEVFDHTLVLCEWNKIRATELSLAMHDLDLCGRASEATIVLNKIPHLKKSSARPSRFALKRIRTATVPS